MATIVDSIWVELVIAAPGTQGSTSWTVEVDPTSLEGCDAEIVLTWVGGQHSKFSGSVAGFIGRVDWVNVNDPQTNHYPSDPYGSVTGGYWNKASQIAFGLAANNCFGSVLIRVNLWA